MRLATVSFPRLSTASTATECRSDWLSYENARFIREVAAISGPSFPRLFLETLTTLTSPRFQPSFVFPLTPRKKETPDDYVFLAQPRRHSLAFNFVPVAAEKLSWRTRGVRARNPEKEDNVRSVNRFERSFSSLADRLSQPEQESWFSEPLTLRSPRLRALAPLIETPTSVTVPRRVCVSRQSCPQLRNRYR